ncbi:type IX secretion system sortase PorU [Rubrivirga sp. IMCC43871]|uniref:type IX secretion system sortase PorU n=1 Tax=Rubrivirga sp. IMCC43871 TaxID=3391575 RepID=UPI00398FF5C2
MPRFSLVYVVALLAAVPALAQDAPVSAARFAQERAQTPTLRVLDTSPNAVTVEASADWRAPLADALEQSRGDLEVLVALASAGRPILSHEIPLVSAVPPSVTVVSVEEESVALPAGIDGEALARALAGPLGEVVGIGESRRQLVGSLAVRMLRVADGRLIRARRAVVRVPKPPFAARLAASGDDNPHLDVARSVLAEGTWFKVPIPTDGVYRIDAAFLSDSLGVTAQIGQVGVYGIGGRILPAQAGAPRPADLQPIAALQQNGALVFYAEGPQWWDWTADNTGGGHWEHDISPFSDVSYYFLRVDDPSPARIGSAAFPSWPTVTTLGRVAARRFYEVDATNIPRDGSGSGLDWFGPEINIGSTGLSVLAATVAGAGAADPVVYRGRVAARANPGVTFTLLKNNSALATTRPGATDLGSLNAGNLANDARFEATAPYGTGLGVTVRASGGNTGASAWIDWVEAVVERVPTASEGYLAFPTPGGAVGRFEIPLAGFSSEPQVWDVTDAAAIRRLGVQAAGGSFRTRVEAVDAHREVVAFDPAGAAVRTPGGLEAGAVAVATQNLHGLAGTPTYVVVTHPDFRASAERLAAHRQQDGLAPIVVTTQQVFNEFAGGAPDMRAVRDYMKFLYDRAPAGALPEYLLLFGDGHYDFRGIRTDVPNYVPTFQTENMINRTTSYTTDDFFGMLGDDEGRLEYNDTTSFRVDIGVGRIPSRTVSDATTIVDKIIRYDSPATRGDWRTRFTFVADDQYPREWDKDLHVLNADATAELAEIVDPTVTLQKIYGPSYPSVITARGQLRPQATEAIRQSINEGTLVWNYSGHGGPDGLGDEDYVTETLVRSLDNVDRLPVFVTATCSFGKFDIADYQSMAEQILLRPGGGGVAMLTTVRLVYTSSNPGSGTNFGLNLELTEQMLTREPDGRPARLGDALRRTKNTAIGASSNNRKFNLLGDPAMRLGLPERSVALTLPPAFEAFQEATVSGTVLGLDGQPDPTYRGEVSLTVFDAQRLVELPPDACCWTDGPDADFLGDYTARTDKIYTGRATVAGGLFSSTFLVPQDVSYSGLPARVVAYALGENGTDGVGQSTEATVSTTAGSRPDDRVGPTITLFVGDSTFVDGGTASSTAHLVARLSDPSGLNAVGAGVGHELLATVDGDASKAVDLGRYYQADLDTYRSGTVRVPLTALGDLTPGEHTVSLTAWDALNNASTASLSFVVVDEGVLIRSALPYPNPTAGPSRFFVEHNQPIGTSADLQIRIYSLAGRPVRTMDGAETLPEGFLSDRTVQVSWDGLDDDQDRLGSGVYLVRIRLDVPSASGGSQVAERIERLAIIR